MATNYVNPLPGVPAVESPFFDELFGPGDEVYELAKALNENGYAVWDFPDPDLDAMAERIKADLHPRYDWANWSSGRGADMRVQDAWQFNDDVRRIATNPAVIDILSKLYGRQAFPFQTLNFPVGTQQHFHTDSVHFSARPERFMCGVWLALEDIGPEQGPLIYYPGSHKLPIYTNEHIGCVIDDPLKGNQVSYHSMWERLAEKRGLKMERFSVRKGQALIWASNLLHGGDFHEDRSQTRWSQVTHYYFENCSYYTPLASNEPLGEIYHRRPYNIVTGKEVDCFYNGLPVPDKYIRSTVFDGSRLPAVNQEDASFDPEAYLAVNPDVREAGVDPLLHWKLHGRAEGRPMR